MFVIVAVKRSLAASTALDPSSCKTTANNVSQAHAGGVRYGRYTVNVVRLTPLVHPVCSSSYCHSHTQPPSLQDG